MLRLDTMRVINVRISDYRSFLCGCAEDREWHFPLNLPSGTISSKSHHLFIPDFIGSESNRFETLFL